VHVVCVYSDAFGELDTHECKALRGQTVRRAVGARIVSITTTASLRGLTQR
jgi:hypothetical protein